MHSFSPYVGRPTEYVDQVERGGWRLKVYSISATSLPLSGELVSMGIDKVLPHLPQPAVTEQRYGVGFLIIHHGTIRNWYLLDWWEQEDIIHHKLFSSPLHNPGSISPEPDKSLIACVHELRVVNFESEAWIKTVLYDDGRSSLDEYLKLRLSSKEMVPAVSNEQAVGDLRV